MAVKYGAAGSWVEDALELEASRYQSLQPLQVGCVRTPDNIERDLLAVRFHVMLGWAIEQAVRANSMCWFGRTSRAVSTCTYLQDVHIPALLYYGPASGGRVVLLTKRVFGRPLRVGGEDAHLLQLALVPLRAVHAAGFLVGVLGLMRWYSQA
jgi:hypothetical protein